MGEWHTTQASRRRRELSSLISAEAPPQYPRVRPHPRSCGAVVLCISKEKPRSRPKDAPPDQAKRSSAL